LLPILAQNFEPKFKIIRVESSFYLALKKSAYQWLHRNRDQGGRGGRAGRSLLRAAH
jgi:hypothetical protein